MDSWQRVQEQLFVDWVNSVVGQRGLSIHDLGADLADGLILINLLEILTNHPIQRYCKKPLSLVQRLDNINVAISFVQAFLHTSVVGLNAQDIASGNTKQAMGLAFFLTQKFPNTTAHILHNSHSGTTTPKINTPSTTPTPEIRVKPNQTIAQKTSETAKAKPKNTTVITPRTETLSPSKIVVIPPPAKKIEEVRFDDRVAAIAREVSTPKISTTTATIQQKQATIDETAFVRKPEQKKQEQTPITLTAIPTTINEENPKEKELSSTNTIPITTTQEKEKREKVIPTPSTLPLPKIEEKKRSTSADNRHSHHHSHRTHNGIHSPNRENNRPHTTEEVEENDSFRNRNRSRNSRERRASFACAQMVPESQDQDQEESQEKKNRKHKHRHHSHDVSKEEKKQLLELVPKIEIPTQQQQASSPLRTEHAPRLSPRLSPGRDESGRITPSRHSRSSSMLLEAAFYGHSTGRTNNLLEPWGQDIVSMEDIRKSVFISQAFMRLKKEGSMFKSSMEALKAFKITFVTLKILLKFKKRFVLRLNQWRVTNLIAKNERRRNEVLAEIKKSERNYVDSLRLIDRLFYTPAQEVVSEQQMRHIFSNIQIIRKYNELLLQKIEERMSNWTTESKIGDIFIELSKFLRVYTPYVNNYSASFAAIQEVLSENKKFSEYLDKCKLSPECGGLDMNSYLIMPIQRLPRYVLLLQDLVKFTKKEHPDYPQLEQALSEIREVANYVNEKKRNAENLLQVLNIQKKLIGKCENLAIPSRRFVRQGILLEVDDKNFSSHVCFLFNDILLLSKPKADHGVTLRWKRGAQKPLSLDSLEEVLSEEGKYLFEALISIRGAGVFDIPDDEGKGLSNAFKLWLPSSKHYLFQCISHEEKISWMTDIDEMISALIEKDFIRFKYVLKSTTITTSNVEETNKVDVSSPDYEGLVQVLGTREWKERWLVLKADNLYFFPDARSALVKNPKPLKILPVLAAKISRVTEKPHAFLLIAQVRIYTVAAQDSTQLYRWLLCIRQAGMSRLAKVDELKPTLQCISPELTPTTNTNNNVIIIPGSPSLVFDALRLVPTTTTTTAQSSALQQPSSPQQQEKLQPTQPTDGEANVETQEKLDILRSQPHNKICADCSRPLVAWVSLTHGVFLCTECSTLHRQLDNFHPGTSEIISIRALLRRSVSDLENLIKYGNARANLLLETKIPAGIIQPLPEDSRLTKLKWIEAKYAKNVPRPDFIECETSVSAIARESSLFGLSAPLKTGTLLKKEGTVAQDWRKYDLMLTNESLFYRKHSDNTNTTKPWKPIELTLCTQREPDRQIPGAPFAFELVMPMRIFIFSVETKEEKKSWVDAFASIRRIEVENSS